MRERALEIGATLGVSIIAHSGTHIEVKAL